VRNGLQARMPCIPLDRLRRRFGLTVSTWTASAADLILGLRQIALAVPNRHYFIARRN
jgi:hypothetical protein